METRITEQLFLALIVAASREGAFRIYDMRSNTLNKRDSCKFPITV